MCLLAITLWSILMLSAFMCIYNYIYVHYATVANVNAKHRDATDGMTPNRFVVSFVFISVIAVTVIAALLAQYLRGLSTDYEEHEFRHVFVPLPSESIYTLGDDWENRTQGLWISPHLPKLPEFANSIDGESPTDFKKDLVQYLSKYRHLALTQWIWAVRRADFSAVNVFLVAPVPGSHRDVEVDFWGHKKLACILSRHTTLLPDTPQWPIVAQSFSLGKLGLNFENWLSRDIIPCMSRETTKGLKNHPNFKFIFPSIENYKHSFDCQNLSCCLPNSAELHSKQQWIKSYLYQWRAKRTGRDRAMPRIKSYTRISPDLKSIPWFVFTSANLSKAAWGVERSTHYIMSYEAGIIFIPKFITKTTTFPIEDEDLPSRSVKHRKSPRTQ